MHTRQLHFIPSPVFFPSTGDGTKDLSLTLELITCQDSLGRKHHCYSYFLDGKLGWVGKDSVASYSGFTRVQVQPGARI